MIYRVGFCNYSCAERHELRFCLRFSFFFLFISYYLYIFGVTFVYANLCVHILALIIQDGGKPFPVTRLPVLNRLTDLSQHTVLLPSLHR